MSSTLKNIVIGLGAGGMLLIGTGLQQTLRLVDISSQLARVAEARLLVATGHVYLEEILSGDAALTPAIVQDHFSDADLELTAAATTDSSLQREWQALARSGHEVAQLAAARMAGTGEDTGTGAGAGSALDQQFDARFDAFMSEAGTLQTTLSAQMQRATTLLRWQTAALLAVLTGFLLLLFRLMRQTQQAAEAMVASARIQEKNTELLAHREQLERANHEQNALLALSAKCEQADTVEALSAIVTRELSTHCNAFAAVAWLLPASQNGADGRVVASLMVQPSRLPSQPCGVVLQAARNRLAIAFEVAPTYYRIDDALVTGLSPSAVHVLPVTCLDRVVAVFEFAFAQPPSEATIRFLETALQSLALRFYLFGQDAAA